MLIMYRECRSCYTHNWRRWWRLRRLRLRWNLSISRLEQETLRWRRGLRRKKLALDGFLGTACTFAGHPLLPMAGKGNPKVTNSERKDLEREEEKEVFYNFKNLNLLQIIKFIFLRTRITKIIIHTTFRSNYKISTILVVCVLG